MFYEIETISIPRTALRTAAFLGGAFGAMYGFTRMRPVGALVGLGGVGAMLWGLRELVHLRGRGPSDDIVTEASQESFPASDAPSWTPTSRAGGPKIH